MPPDGLPSSNPGSVPSFGAPWLRTTFTCPAKLKATRLCIAAPGWFECYINGKRVGEQVLAPVVTQFTEHSGYIVFDITKLLKPGKNAIAVLLGNGWYNCQTRDAWTFHDAPWRNQPSLLLQIEETASEKVLLCSDDSWKAAKSQVVCNSLRNGETVDTRINDDGVSTVDFDDSNLPYVDISNPPPGALFEQECESCVITERIEPVASKVFGCDGYVVYDFGRNITGWCEIDAQGAAGVELVLDYREQVDENGIPFSYNIDGCTDLERFQQDKFILSGEKLQTGLHPHFTYHGFRYVKVNYDPNPWTNAPTKKLAKITACAIHSDFKQGGSFHTASNNVLERLQQMGCYSIQCCYIGYPNDCPHREKNGWSGDAMSLIETQLWNFDIANCLKHYTQNLMDTQRPSGQICALTPTGGWGYNWGNGPAWDSYVFEVAYQLWFMRGDDSIIRKYYDSMALYLQYCRQWHDIDGIVPFGLGDWTPYKSCNMPDPAEITTGFYYQDNLRMAEFAKLLGKKEDVKKYTDDAKRIYDAFNKKFAHADGGYDNDMQTALGTALYFNLAKDPKKTIAKLVALVRKQKHVADFGFWGAKFVPNVLARYGYTEDVIKILTQPEMPGWGYWLKDGATTFRECWEGTASQIHETMANPFSTLYRYVAGIAPTKPGFKEFTLTPATDLKELPDFDCVYNSPYGEIRSALKTNKNGKKQYICTIPKGTSAILTLNGKKQTLTEGEYKF